MVSILPTKRSPWDIIGQAMTNYGQYAPQLLENRYQQKKGLTALDEVQGLLNKKDEAGNPVPPNPIEMALGFAKAGVVAPQLERVLAPLYESAMRHGKAQTVYGKNTGQTQGQPQGQMAPEGTEAQPMQPKEIPPEAPRKSQLNLTNPEQMHEKATQDALRTGDPTQYQRSMDEQQTRNDIVLRYRDTLENMARREGISDQEMADFMEVAEPLASDNLDQWLKNARTAYAPVKEAMDTYYKAFIPKYESALTGVNREKALEKLVPTSQKMKKMGREKQARTYLASQWLTPTEIEEQFNPLGKTQTKSLENLPKGVFPAHKRTTWGQLFKGEKPKHLTNPFVTYEEAVEKAPKEMKIMQDRLSNFFLKNVDDDTSLLVLRDKLWDDKDYDWRQIGPAIRQAEEKGLKLNSRQQNEMSTIDTQEPIQSLPAIFQDFWRFVQLPAGQK